MKKSAFTVRCSCLLAIGSLLATALTSPAQPALQVVFPDANLDAVVREALHKLSSDVITPDEMLTLTELNADNRGITNTVGLETAVNLTNLIFSSNPVTDYSGIAGLSNLLHLEFNYGSISNLSFLPALQRLESLSIYDNRISDVTPLAALTALRRLQLDWNPVTNHVTLGSLTNLTELFLAGNGISQLDFLTPLPQLERLSLYNDGVRDLSPLAGRTQLHFLVLGWNGVTNPAVLASLTGLRELELNGNSLTNVSYLAGLTNLTGLDLAYTALADMTPVTNLSKLVWLNVGENSLTALPDLSGFTNLDTLMMAGNSISDLTPVTTLAGTLKNLHLQRDPFADISPLTNCLHLESILFSQNTVTNLSLLAQIPSLRSLQLEAMHFTNLTQVDFLATLPQLWWLDLNFNRLADLAPLTNYPALSELRVQGNHLQQIEPLLSLPWLTFVNLRENYLDLSPTFAAWHIITNLQANGVNVEYDPQNPPPVFPHIVIQPMPRATIVGDNARFQVVTEGGTPTVYYQWQKNGLDLADDGRIQGAATDTLQINSVTAADAGSYRVRVSDDWIETNSVAVSLRVVTTFAFADPHLEQAILDRLGITNRSLTLDDLKNVDWLNAANRGITNLSGIEACANLTAISLNENSGILDYTPLTALPGLTYLELNNSAVSGIDFITALPALNSLHLWGGTFTDVSPLLTKPGMRELNLGGNAGITHLEVLNTLTNLEALALDSDGLSNLTFVAFMPRLNYLNLANNALQDIGLLAGETNLLNLDLGANQITNAAPLASCTRLEWLNLAANQITDLSFASGLTDLSFLDVNNNPFSDVLPLAGLIHLTGLNVGDSLVTDLSPLASLTSLRELNMWNLGASNLAFLALLTNLEALGVGNNQVSNFVAYPSLNHLRYVNLSGNPLANLNFTWSLAGLRELHINGTGMSNLTALTGQTNLEVLGLAGNGISDIGPLATLPRLTWLTLWDNRLQDITALAVQTHLTYADVRYNELSLDSGSAAMAVINLLQARGTRVDFLPQNSPLAFGPDAFTLALYHFDEASGVTAADASGNGLNLSVAGGAGFGTGIFGNGLILPNSNSVYAARPASDAALDLASGDFTVELYAKFNHFAHEQTLIEKWMGNSGPGWTFTCINAHQVRFHLDTTVYLDVDPNLQPDTWYHLAAQRSGSEVSVWCNGVKLGAITFAGTATRTTMPLLIGRRNADDGRFFAVDGVMDEVRISSVARYGTMNVPPVITQQPVSQTVFAGEPTGFNVTAYGLGTLYYQWRKAGTNLIAATTRTLTLSAAQPVDAGNYDVVVSSGSLSVTSSVATLTVKQCQEPPGGLVAWWSGELSAADIAGANHGTLSGSATYGTGLVGEAFLFNGSAGSVIVPDSASLELTSRFTIEAWVKLASLTDDPNGGGRSIVSKVGGAGGNNGYQFGFSQNILFGGFNSPGQPWGAGNYGVASPALPALTTNVWYHVAWTYDQSAEVLYFNGAPVATNAVGAHAIATSISTLRISGDDNGNVMFDGAIDEVSIYNRALVADEIAAIHAAGSAGKCRPIVTFVAVDDFNSTNGNPNGVWSYGWMPTDFSSFNLYVNHGNIANGSGPIWYGWNGDLTPALWKNLGGSSYGVPSGWLSLHPGPGTQPSVLRWTAPAAGLVHVLGQFLPGDGGYMQVAVRRNNQPWWNAGDAGAFDLQTNVVAGTTIDFAVYGGYGYGNTPISALISYLGPLTNSAPAITHQPQDQIVYVGDNPSFRVTAVGTAPLNYQWRKNGGNIGATNATLTFTNVQPAATGGYDVVVANNYGSVTSQVANLTVQLAADLALNVSAAPNPVVIGSNLTFTVTVTNKGPSPASGIFVTNVLPASVNLVTASTSQGSWSSSGQSIVASLGSLAAHATATLVATATPMTVGTITNVASVTAAETDFVASNNLAAATVTVMLPQQSVLFVNVSGGYNGDGYNFYQTLTWAGANATWVNLSANGQVATLMQSNAYDQVWVYDLSTAADNYTADWQAIANWFNQRTSRNLICDGRIISSYWSGRYNGEGKLLTQNYYENLKSRGGGLMLGTDHSAYQPGINTINDLIGIGRFSGDFSLSSIPIDTNSPLTTVPNNLGSALSDDSSPGQAPFGLQTNGMILYSVAWHSGNTNTPGISTTIRGGVGFRVYVAAPPNNAQFNEDAPVSFAAQAVNGSAPFNFRWTSDRDGTFAVGSPVQVSMLSTGLHLITLVGTEAGGGADSDSIHLTILPVTPAVTLALQPGNDSGVSTNDGITTVAMPVFDVTVNKRGQIEFDYTGDGTPDEIRTNITPGTYVFNAPALADGVHNFTARFVPLHGAPVTASMALTIDTQGPQVVAMEPLPGSLLNQGFDHADLTFSEAVDAGSFTIADATLTGPAGAVSVSGVSALASNRFRVSFPMQTAIGNYQLAIGPGIADVAGNLMNQNGNATNGEPADAFAATLTIALPDLAVASLTAPAAAQPGVPFELNWVVTNRGNALATGNETETLFVSNSVSGAESLATLNFSGTIAAGAAVTRTQTVTLPANGPAGELQFYVVVDSGNAIAELSELNNFGYAGNTTTVPLKLKLEISAMQIAENAANPNVPTTITRNGDRTQALTVTLGNSGPTHLSVPASVVIPTGLATTNFNLRVMPDGLVTGPQIVTISATATNFLGDSGQITVLDVDQPYLTLTLETNVMVEGHTLATVVTRSLVTTYPLTVSLGSSDPNRLNVPASVTIPANGDSAVFAILAQNNTLIDPPQFYTISATAAGLATAGANVTVNDDDTPVVTATLANHIVSESAGPQATVGTVTRAPVSTRAVMIQLTSSDTNAAQVPAQVIIPANAASANFTVAAVNDPRLTGPKSVVIGGGIIATLSNVRVADIKPDTLTVTDDSSPSLQIAFGQKIVKEGANPATTVTVTRNTPATNDLVVNVVSSDTNKLVAPDVVTISNGQSSVTFPMATISDNVNSGNATITVTASAAGFASASDNIVVTDIDLPDLVVASITVPVAASTESSTNVSYRIINQGLAAVNTNFLTRVFLSNDALGSSLTLINQYRFANLPVGAYFDLSVPVTLPQTVGDYWIVVKTDVEDNVVEGLKDNNSGTSKTAIQVNPAYGAWVRVSPPKLWLAGTPVPMTGRATNSLGAGVAFKPVNLHVVLRGTDRVISTLTDANGYFNATFQPLVNEAGSYQVFATHPGVSTGTTQDTFTLLGMKVNPTIASATFSEQSSASGAVAIENLSDVALTGLSASVMSQPAALGVTIGLGGTTIPGSGSVGLNYTMSAGTTAGSGVVRVHLRTAEGVEADAFFTVSVVALRAKLVTDPAQLIAGMVGGKQVTVQFNVTNAGAIATGPVTVSLPAAEWLQLASTNPMPSLAPGETNQVTLVLTPPAGLPLGPYNGSLALNCNGDGISVPFTFRCLSESKGDLVVSTVDEHTFFAANSPKLTNAAVTVRDAFSHAVVTNGVTDSSGLFHAGPLMEGYYEISASAAKHNSYSGSRFVTAGTTNEVEAFLNLQTVQYIWTVEPTEIEDRTKITIETVFETYVPAPVVTIEPALIDLADIKADVSQVNLKIVNHGLIAAKDFKLNMPAHALWEFTPLISDIGTIPAQSSLTVPLTIRRITPGALMAKAVMAKTASASSDCNTAGDGCFHFDCGVYSFSVCLPVNFIHAADDCTPPSVPGLPFVFNLGGGGSLGGGGGGGGGGPMGTGRIDPPQVFSVKSCEECVQKLAKAVLDCIVGLLPTEAVSDGFKCGYDVFTYTPVWGTGSLDNSINDSGLLLDCMSAIGHGTPGLGQIISALSCLDGLMGACLNAPGSGSGSGGGSTTPKALRASDVSMLALDKTIPSGFAASVSTSLANKFPALLTLAQRGDRLATYPSMLQAVLGDDAWFTAANNSNWSLWLATFSSYTRTNSENGARISDTERALLLALPVPDGLTAGSLTKVLDRWNRSIDYYAAGIVVQADVPAGQSTDFIAYDTFTNAVGAFMQAEDASRAEGFPDSYAAFVDGYDKLKNQIQGFSESGSGTCAKVRLVLDQEAIISRDAFRATLEIINGSDGQLRDVSVDVKIVDPSGVNSTNLFGIRPPTLVNLSAVDGTGTIEAQTTGETSWTIIPTSDAAPAVPAVYYVSGTLKYTQDGLLVTVPLAAVPITVYPNPKLYIKYFHQRDVYADDPFTPQIEPSIPFSLAVMVENRGKGTARNMRITSSQPRIVENEKGLLIDFQIIGTEVSGQNITPSLTVNFGNIGPGNIAIGRWLMTSTLQGLFEDYKATFENVDDLGNKKLSLIDEVTIHEMIHLVQAQGVFEDGKPDFLVNDIPDVNDRPDTLYLSDGTTNPVSVVEASTIDALPSASHPLVQLTAPMASGWTYLRVPEPGNGQFTLTKVLRSDGVEIYFRTNVWTTDRTFIGMGRRPVSENILHLLDYNSTGSYTLYYGAAPAADASAPSSSVAALPVTSSPAFAVQWSGTDDNSGIASYDIYASVNGGNFAPWLTQTKLVSAMFNGIYGSTYAFFSLATDHSGNRESLHLLADATTTVTPNITAGTDQLGTIQDTSVGAPLVKLLANDKDGAGAPLSITAVSPASVRGGSVTLSSGLAIYSPPPGYAGLDSFTYTVSDALGGSAQGTVNVSVTSSNSLAQNVIAITKTDSNWLLQFAGIPGRGYIIQFTDQLTGPWSDLSDPANPVIADNTGLIQFTDNTTPVPVMRFYRTRASVANP